MAKAGQIPVNKNAVDSQEVRSIPDLDLFLDAIKTAKGRPALAVWPKMDGLLSDAIMSAMLAEKSVSKALRDAAREMDELLKE
jgi:ABC-type glycerol-3-phosphate transport system substrate-binding protein